MERRFRPGRETVGFGAVFAAIVLICVVGMGVRAGLTLPWSVGAGATVAATVVVGGSVFWGLIVTRLDRGPRTGRGALAGVLTSWLALGVSFGTYAMLDETSVPLTVFETVREFLVFSVVGLAFGFYLFPLVLAGGVIGLLFATSRPAET
jgi:hypothetical protein